MKLAYYIRASTSAQEDSPVTQETLARDWAKQNGHTFVEWYTEDFISAGKPVADRPAAAAMFARLTDKSREWQGIFVVRKDRLFRDLYDEIGCMRLLARHKVTLFTQEGEVDHSTPEAEFMSNVMGAASQLERRLTGRRIKEHNLARAMQGKIPSGFPPLGLRYDTETKRIEATERAGDALMLFQTYIETGNCSETARRLNLAGKRTVNGKAFASYNVLIILRSAYYRQQVRYAGRTYEMPDIPRIIPVEMTAAVDRMLSQRQPAARAIGSPSPYSGRLTCGVCGRPMHRINTRSFSKRYYGFFCMDRRCGVCPSSKIAERFIDQLAGKAITTLFSKLLRILPQEELKPPPRRLNPTRQALIAKRQRVIETYQDGVIPRDEYLRAIERINDDLSRITEDTPAAVNAETVMMWAESIGDNWQALPADSKRELFLLLDAQFIVHSVPGEKRALELITTAYTRPIREELRQRSPLRARTLGVSRGS